MEEFQNSAGLEGFKKYTLSSEFWLYALRDNRVGCGEAYG